MSGVSITPEAFGRVVADYTRLLHAPGEVRDGILLICGNEDRAEVFTDPRGVGLARFAGLAGVPPSTVRHLIREDLLRPYEVNTKFKFLFHSLAEVDAVRQWQDLGLTLDEIRDQMRLERLGGLYLNVHTPDGLEQVVIKRRHPTDDEFEGFKMVDDAQADQKHDPYAYAVEIRRARERLEARLAELEQRVQRARELEQVLSKFLSKPVEAS